MRIGADGSVRYGPQRYAAVVLYHPEFEKPETAAFFQQAAGGPTALYRVGNWTMDFDGRPLDGNSKLPKRMVVSADAAACAAKVIAHLQQAGIEPQTPATGVLTRFGRRSSSPPTSGHCRLIDGTEIVVAGTVKPSGDPIRAVVHVGPRDVHVDAVGVVGVRLAQDGSLEALAAGGLKHFQTDQLEITLDHPVDIALWRDTQGTMHGVLQDCNGPVPSALKAISNSWLRLAAPTPLAE